MISRVTNSMLLASAQRNLQSSMSQLGRLQDQASSQKRLTKPSDDPQGVSEAMQVRGQQRAAEQYARNIADGEGWLTTIDAALKTSTSILQKARDLVVQGNNSGSLSQPAREAIALELESLRDELLKQANTEYLGQPVFAGNSTDSVAFDATYTHTGVDGSKVDRRVGTASTIQVDADGAKIFGEGADSVFALITDAVAGLRAGNNLGPQLSELDTRITTVLGEHALVGSRYTQLERVRSVTMDQSLSLESQLAGIEDVDLGRVIIDLKSQEIAYQTALAVTSRALQPTLMSFLA
ncbi:flagellar hook-associated protein FlgL [Lysobacter korlensis]|uniref:Flagellar hook-associated protein FlgL n=1 Tax=Lysobacter korlensis TaxID=553636 RepID=A0ABV6RXR4_9GAMM